jgi:hypothetical protein
MPRISHIALLACVAFSPWAVAQSVPYLPANPETDKTYPVRAEGFNRSVRLMIANAAELPSYGNYKAPAGTWLMVMGTEWENVIPLTYVKSQKKAIGTTYAIPNLADHLYLVLNGREVVKLSDATAKLPGHVPVQNFKLAKLGDRLRGNLIFTVPDRTDLGYAEIRYYDFTHGHAVIPLGDPAVGAKLRTALKPVSPPQKNEVVEAGVYGVEKLKSVNGKEAPTGQTYVSVDFRATSQFTFEGDASAFDSKAAPGRKMQIGTVADWTDALQYVQLVVDGEVSLQPIAGLSTLGETPRFLPDLPTGGKLVFLAPADYKSLELKCTFPNGKTPSGQVIHPKPLTIAVEGTPPALAEIKPIKTLEDDVFVVHFLKSRLAPDFAGIKAGDGQQLWVVDVAVQNRGQAAETFQTKDQLRYMAADVQQEAAPVTWTGPRPAAELLLIPPGERRSFQIVFNVPAADAAPKLGYNGISKAEVVELPKP